MRQRYTGKDIIDRLHHTVIRYKNYPYLCIVESTENIHLMDVVTGNLQHKVHPEDDDLDISSIRVGYINLAEPNHRLAVYLKREPLRRYKQGIEFERLTQKVLRDGVSYVNANQLSCKGFVDSVLGIYPSLDQAVTWITKNNWHSVAISRDIALKHEGELLKVYIKDDEVGYMKLGSRVVIVPKTELSWYSVFLLGSIPDWVVQE